MTPAAAAGGRLRSDSGLPKCLQAPSVSCLQLVPGHPSRGRDRKERHGHGLTGKDDATPPKGKFHDNRTRRDARGPASRSFDPGCWSLQLQPFPCLAQTLLPPPRSIHDGLIAGWGGVAIGEKRGVRMLDAEMERCSTRERRRKIC